MRLVVFGLTISSSWGNGHATLWRGLASALAERGHHLSFYERDAPWYAASRDLSAVPGGALVLYQRWEDVVASARQELARADCGIVTSYCPDGVAASDLVTTSHVPARIFYDMDTPVTLERARRGERVDYIGPRGLSDFDLALSFTGGEALAELARTFGARRVLPLYGSVDPAVHRPVGERDAFRGDLSYLGTFAASRQHALEQLFVEPARRRRDRTFVIGGSMYGSEFPWCDNIRYVDHLPPVDHPAFFCSSPLTLNVTRGPMAVMGYCPSGRLFEAAACGTPVLSDAWPGLETFFEPGREILVGRSSDDVTAAIDLGPERLARIGRAARERVLAEHTAARRAHELLEAIVMAADSRRAAPDRTLQEGA